MNVQFPTYTCDTYILYLYINASAFIYIDHNRMYALREIYL
jgi:hypothetical protein